MTESAEPFVLFPDTNTLLHYPTIRSVDWKAVCAAKTVRIVLCMQVVHELDTKKDDSRLRDRAARVIKELDSIIDASGEVRAGVMLEVFNYEVRNSDFPDTLSPDSKDDRIVHSVKKFLERNLESKVAVYSEDMGMRLRCKANSVAVIKPDPSTRLLDPASEQEKKYKAAITELNAVKNLSPQVSLLVSSFGASAPSESLPVFVLPLAPAERNLSAEFDEHVSSMQLESLSTESLSNFLPPSQNAIHQYNKKLKNHLDEYRQWLELRRVLEIAESQTFESSLWLSNEGGAPAEDLDLEIVFAETVFRITEENSKEAKQLEIPEAPKPPERPRQLFVDDGLLHRMVPIQTPFHDFARFNPFETFANLNVSVKQDGEDSPFRITVSCKRLKQHDPICVGRFFATLRADGLKPFVANYRMSVANLPKPITGEIRFVIQLSNDGGIDQTTAGDTR